MKLSDIAIYVKDRIKSDDISLERYVTTDSILQNKKGRVCAENMPPVATSLTHFQCGDVLVANIRPYLKKIWLADISGGSSNDVLTFRPKKDYSSEYLYAALSQDIFFEYMMKGKNGTRMPRGNKLQIMNFPLISLNHKQILNIGGFISSFDRKIALNKAINQNLEKMAKQLYEYWFVQFDFPDENGRPYKSSGGKMVWNDKLKREIPEGWENKDIKCFMRIFTGKKDVSKTIPGIYKFFSCSMNPSTSNEYIYDGCAILVCGNGVTGRVLFYNGKFDLYQRTYACVLDSDTQLISFFYFTLKYLFEPIYGESGRGSIIPYIVLGDLADFNFAYNTRIVDLFVEKIRSIFDEMFRREVEVDQLTKLRDELLPLLMNGQVSVN